MLKDYCTLWPDFVQSIWIGACCRDHDRAYAEGVSRLEADRLLGECVAALGLPVTGFLMAVGTGLFGWMFYAWKGRKARRDLGSK